jgi:hypothetical protein
MNHLSLEQEKLLEVGCSIVSNTPMVEFNLKGLDWNRFFTLSKMQKIFPSVYRALHHFIPDENRSDWDSEFQLHRTKMDNLLSVLKEVNAVLNQEDLSFSFLKGLTLSTLLFDDLYSRHSNDIDIIFRERDMERAFRVLEGHGFISYLGKDNPFSLGLEAGTSLQIPYPVLKTAGHHEFFELWKQQNNQFVGIEIQRYFHYNITNLEVIDSFIESSRQVHIKDITLKTFDLIPTLFCLCENAYNELSEPGMPISLKTFVDIGVFIRKFKEQMDWQAVISFTEKYQFGYFMKQSLEFTNTLFGNVVPLEIIMAFETKQALNNFRLSIRDLLFLSAKGRIVESKWNRNQLLLNKTTQQIEFADEKEISELNLYHRETVKADRFDLRIRYLVSKTETHFCCHVYFENSAFELLSQYHLALILLDTDLKEEAVDSQYWIKWKSGEFMEESDQKDQIDVAIREINGKHVMTIHIPLHAPAIERGKINDRVYFNFSLRHQIFHNFFHTYDTSTYDFYSFYDKCVAIPLK